MSCDGAPSTVPAGAGVRTYDEEMAYLERLDPNRWRIKVGRTRSTAAQCSAARA